MKVKEEKKIEITISTFILQKKKNAYLMNGNHFLLLLYWKQFPFIVTVSLPYCLQYFLFHSHFNALQNNRKFK